MIIFLLVSYLVILFFLVKLKVVPFNLLWKLSPIVVLLILTLALFIPMQWGAPQGPALVVRNSVSIVPDVAGEVVDVPVAANTPLKAGDVLFRIDPVPYESQLRALQAQFKLQETRLGEVSQLQSTGTGRTYDVEQRQAEYDQLKAQVDGAKWNLDKTVVRAPADGYVTNLGLRKGARVANLPLSPVMAFIDTSDTIIGVQVEQIFARYIEVGQPVEATFKFMPGKVYPGKVESILQAIAPGQATTSGIAVTPKAIQSGPFIVRIRLDDQAFADGLPAGATGDVAIYTDHIKVAHIIRKVVLRQTAIMNYIIPF